MPVRDIPQIIASASPPAANNISLALNDHCALSKSTPVDSTAFSGSIIHEYPVDNKCSASSDPSNMGSVVTDPVEDMDMMTGISPAYGTLSEVTGDSSNQKREDANGSEDDRETHGSIVKVTAADRQGIVSNNDMFRWGLDSTDTYGPERSVEVYSLCGKKPSNTPMPLVNILTFIFENMISHSNCMISLGSKFLWVRKMETAGDAC
jgi:hypothetical protein